jgi:hypothetical protein
MPTRDRPPDVIALDQGKTWRLSPRSNRANEWLQAHAEGLRDERAGANALTSEADETPRTPTSVPLTAAPTALRTPTIVRVGREAHQTVWPCMETSGLSRRRRACDVSALGRPNWCR